MKSTTIVEAEFSGAHTVSGHPMCGERHGHTWKVQIELATDEKDMDVGTVADIRAVIFEFHARDLDRFLPGVETSASGLAAYFRERLSDFPVTAITIVTRDGFGVRAEWQLR